MTAFPQFGRAPLPLRASAVLGGAGRGEWAAFSAAAIEWEALFASTGLFGIELGPAGALAGQAVELRGFMTPPMMAEADYFVLSRSPLPNCPFCVPTVSWPDDIVVVHLRAPGVDPEHSGRAVAVRGTLETGERAGPVAGLTSHARLRAALWVEGADPPA